MLQRLAQGVPPLDFEVVRRRLATDGALNHLAAKGLNSFSFLPYNAHGDGDNVRPFVARDDKFHHDSSKLDEWGIVFAHAQTLGLHLHVKLQETEHGGGTPPLRGADP